MIDLRPRIQRKGNPVSEKQITLGRLIKVLPVRPSDTVGRIFSTTEDGRLLPLFQLLRVYLHYDSVLRACPTDLPSRHPGDFFLFS